MSISYNIAIEAQILDSTMGGVSTYLTALIHALGLLDGPERYQIIYAEENPEWLNQYLGPNQVAVFAPKRKIRQLVRYLFGKNWLLVWTKGYHLFAGTIARFSVKDQFVPGAIMEMQGFYEKNGARLVHVFPQLYVRTGLPVIFNPHDLQHEHFPEFFTPEELIKRRYVYRTACEKAKIIVAASKFTKEDIITHYQISAEKIKLISFAPATVVYTKEINNDFIEGVLRKFGINLPYIYYPAATWEHKNHLKLLEAILQLRDNKIIVPLVCTGRQIEPTWTKLSKFINENNLLDQIKFLGYLPGEEIRALYKKCKFVIAPSLFEQASGPMVEAWQEGRAVAASNVTSIPDQANNAALLFDPNDINQISKAIELLWLFDEYRTDFEKKGQLRLKDFNWEFTAKAYRSLYRLVANWPLSKEDNDLINTIS